MSELESTYIAVVSLLVQADPSLAGKGSAAIYGMAGKLPDTALLDEFVVQFFNEVYSLQSNVDLGFYC